MKSSQNSFENSQTPDTKPDGNSVGAQRGGSAVKQGLRGSSVRTDARGRDEFHGRGESASFDQGRAEQSGRHYGRSGTETPGPGYGRGPLQPKPARNSSVDYEDDEDDKNEEDLDEEP